MKSRKSVAQKRTIWQKNSAWIILLVVLLGAGGVWYALGAPGAPAGLLTKQVVSAAPAYYTTTVRRGDVQISASGSGVLVASQSVDLSFSTGGTVAELNVKLGDKVTAGQTLARLGNVETVQANLAAAQLAVVQAQQAVDALQENGNVSLAQSFQTLIKAQQTYNNALATDQRTAYARCSQPVNTKYAKALDNATLKLTNLTQSEYGSDLWLTAKGTYDTALANYNYCIGYTSDEKTNASSAVDVAKVTLQQAQTNYDALKSASGVDPHQFALDQAKLNQAKAQLAQAQQQLQGVTITAPVDGIVTFLSASKGEIVDTSKFMTISDTSHPTVQVSLDETDLGKLQVGSLVEVTFDALPSQVFTGKVTAVQPQLVTSGNVQVAQGLAQLDPIGVNAVQNLPLGLNANVTVIDKQAKNTLLVPIQALHDLGGGQYGVFVQGQDGNLKLAVVQVGIMDTTHAQIISGLNVGDVVSTGIAQVK